MNTELYGGGGVEGCAATSSYDGNFSDARKLRSSMEEGKEEAP